MSLESACQVPVTSEITVQNRVCNVPNDICPNHESRIGFATYETKQSGIKRTTYCTAKQPGIRFTTYMYVYTLNNLESSSQLDHKSQRSQCRTGLATYKAPHRPAYWFVGSALLQAVTAKFSRLRRKILKNIIPYAETPYVRRFGFGRIEARARPKHIPVDERPYHH